MYKNEEVEELKQKAILCAVVFIFVVAIGAILIFNRFGSEVDAVSRALRNKDTFVVLFTDDDDRCSTCSLVAEELNSLGVTYYSFNVRVSSYGDVLKRMNVDYEVRLPAIYVLDKGEISFNITNVQDKQTVRDFIKNNDIISLLEKES